MEKSYYLSTCKINFRIIKIAQNYEVSITNNTIINFIDCFLAIQYQRKLQQERSLYSNARWNKTIYCDLYSERHFKG